MELNDLRSVVTLVSFFVFVGIVVWAWKGSRREGFEDAAQLPFVDDLPAAGSQGEKQ